MRSSSPWPAARCQPTSGSWGSASTRSPASFAAKRFSPKREKFGTGEIEGVVAPETAAHAAGTRALLPMPALGIPGSPMAAVMLGGLLIWGLIAGMYLAHVVGLAIIMPFWPLISLVIRKVRRREKDSETAVSAEA